MSELLQGCVSKFPDRAKWAPQGRRRRKSVARGRVHPGSISPNVMAHCDLRGILTTHLRSPLKMQRSKPSIDQDFASGILDKKKVINLTASFNFSALFDEATGHRRNEGIRAGGYFGGDLGFPKLILGALASTQGALWNGELAARSVGNAFAVRKTDRLHFCKGFWAKVPAWTVNMQRFWPSKFTM